MERTRFIIFYTEEVRNEQLPKLPKSIARVILKAIEERLGMAPLEYGKPLRYSLKGYRRLRVGSYRVIYKVDQEKVIVYIVEIDHRKDVYED